MYQLTPYHSPKIWGWENWNLSCHPNGHSTITNGNCEGKTLYQCLESDHPKLSKEFPILIKIIRANSPLSIQVHPNDKMAESYNSLGKSECWYILDSEPNAELVVNFKEKITKDKFVAAIKGDSLEKLVHRIAVRPGNFIYIPAGTVHAIGGGIKLLEIQQSSDITFRVYDYGRGRELHINESIQALDYQNSDQYQFIEKFDRYDSSYFSVSKESLSKKERTITEKTITVTEPFSSITTLSGSLEITSDSDSIILEEEISCYLPPGDYRITSKSDKSDYIRVDIPNYKTQASSKKFTT